MDFDISLQKSDEGYAVWCPALRGCWSQGATKKEAIRNIKIAIKEYLSVAKTLAAKNGQRIRVRLPA